MDFRFCRVANRFPGAIDIIFGRAGEGSDFRRLELAGDSRNGFHIAFRSSWKTGFQDIHSQLFQLSGDS